MSTLVSPAEAVKAQIASLTGEQVTIEAFRTETAPVIEEKEQAPVVEKKDEPAKSVAAPTMDSISDETEPEPAKAEAASDEPREGERPAAFIKRLKQELADAKNQAKLAAEFKVKSVAPDELEALRREIAERDAVIETSAYERSRAFKEQFAAPIEKAATAAKDMIAKFTDTKGIYERALALDGRERLEYLSEHLDAAAGAVFDRMARVDELSKDRDAALSNAQERAKALSAEREDKSGAEVLKAFDSQREDISKRLSVYRGEHADALTQQARALLSGDAAPKDIIQAAYLAAAAPHYINQLRTAQAEIATLKARIAESDGDRATIGGRGSDASKGGGDPTFVNGHLPTVKEVMARQIAAMRG